jgi:hypothetical protein
MTLGDLHTSATLHEGVDFWFDAPTMGEKNMYNISLKEKSEVETYQSGKGSKFAF